MIRLAGVLMLLAGFAVTFVHPWYVTRVADFEIVAAQLYQRQTGAVPLTVELTPDDAPVRYRLDVAMDGPVAPSEAGLALRVETRTATGLVLDDSLLVAAETGAPSEDGRWQASLSMPAFDVPAADDYTIGVTVADPSAALASRLESVRLSVIGNAGAGMRDWQPLGYILIVVGSLAYLVGRPRRDGGDTRSGRHRTGKPGRTSQIGRKTPLEESLKPQGKSRPKKRWGRAGSE